MKVGTDGILLGAWTSFDHNPSSILDIGAGTGLIALQMAQRTTADTVDAIELNEDAFEQCVENFEASQWSDRLFCYHVSFQEFYVEMDEPYDLIVSNPPFYSETVKSGDVARDNARQNQSLPFGELLVGVEKLLSEKGQFAVIIPFDIKDDFLELAERSNLFANRITLVRGNFETPIKRALLQFSRKDMAIEENEIVIEKEKHVYTETYRDLTKAFYLNM